MCLDRVLGQTEKNEFQVVRGMAMSSTARTFGQHFGPEWKISKTIGRVPWMFLAPPWVFFFICGFEWNVTITVGWIVIKFGAQLHVTLVITFSSGTIIRLSLTEPREWLLNNWLQDGKYLHSLLYVSITLNSGSFFVKIPLAEVGLGIMIIMYCETSPNCC